MLTASEVLPLDSLPLPPDFATASLEFSSHKQTINSRPGVCVAVLPQG